MILLEYCARVVANYTSWAILGMRTSLPLFTGVRGREILGSSLIRTMRGVFYDGIMTTMERDSPLGFSLRALSMRVGKGGDSDGHPLRAVQDALSAGGDTAHHGGASPAHARGSWFGAEILWLRARERSLLRLLHLRLRGVPPSVP